MIDEGRREEQEQEQEQGQGQGQGQEEKWGSERRLTVALLSMRDIYGTIIHPGFVFSDTICKTMQAAPFVSKET